MPTPVITALPAAPSRADPANFAARGDALLGALPAFVTQANALAADLTTKSATADAQGTAAVQAAGVASSARDAALSYRDTANGAAQTAVAKAGEAAGSASAAAASAASASAVSGIPALSGHAGQSLRVKADGSGMEWVITGDALGFTPVQQGGGVGQGANKLYFGWASSGGGLKVQVDSTDQGFVTFSSTSPVSGILTYNGLAITAASINCTHYGNGANLTGLTAAQINTAYGYTPQNAAFFAPGAKLDTGRYLDFHYSNLANTFDARLQCLAPSGANGSSVLYASAAGFQVGGWVDASYYTGGGQFLTGFTSAQITGALGFTPPNQVAPALYCQATANVGSTGAQGVPVVQGAGGGDHAFMQFLRPGQYGINWGLAADNSMCLGGYSHGANTYRLTSDASGNLVALGNLTSTSDIRFKTELQRLTHVVKRLCAIDKGGMRYLDTRTGEHKYGVSAQGVQKYFPDAVVADERGHLSVAYGQLALAALIEVTREFSAEIANLKNEILELKARGQ